MKITRFFTLLVLISFSIYFSSCFCKKGKGNVTTQTRQLAAFEEIDIDGQAELILDQGTTQSIKVQIDTNLLEYVVTEVSGKKLKIHDKRCFKNITDYKIYITTVNLTDLYVDGSVKIKGETAIKSDKLFIKNRGTGEVQLSLDVNKLEIKAGGSGLLKLFGRALEMDVDLDGAGSIEAFGLQAKEVDAQVNGAGTFRIDVTENLDADVGGSGNIFYRGNPKKVETNITGSGTIQAK